jgi:hypothetical protein
MHIPKIKILLGALGLLLLASGCAKPVKTSLACTVPYNTPVTVGSTELCTQVVSSTENMQKGLSGKSSMEDSQGMIFDFTGFGSKTIPSFWMKDMQFDLDLIWIKDKKIIAITKNVPAPKDQTQKQESNLTNYSPPSPVSYVLEVNSGWSEKNNLTVGDQVTF